MINDHSVAHSKQAEQFEAIVSQWRVPNPQHLADLSDRRVSHTFILKYILREVLLGRVSKHSASSLALFKFHLVLRQGTCLIRENKFNLAKLFD